MPYVSGNVGKLVINGFRYAFSRASYNLRMDSQRTTNSEAYGAGSSVAAGFVLVNGYSGHTSINSNYVFEFSATAITFDPTSYNPFSTTFNLAGGAFVRLQFFPGGIPGVSWLVPSFHVATGGGDDDVMGLSPTNFSGESNGGVYYSSAFGGVVIN